MTPKQVTPDFPSFLLVVEDVVLRLLRTYDERGFQAAEQFVRTDVDAVLVKARMRTLALDEARQYTNTVTCAVRKYLTTTNAGLRSNHQPQD